MNEKFGLLGQEREEVADAVAVEFAILIGCVNEVEGLLAIYRPTGRDAPESIPGQLSNRLAAEIHLADLGLFSEPLAERSREAFANEGAEKVGVFLIGEAADGNDADAFVFASDPFRQITRGPKGLFAVVAEFPIFARAK